MDTLANEITNIFHSELKSANEPFLRVAGSLGWTVPPDIPYTDFKSRFDNSNPVLERIDKELFEHYLNNIDELFKCIEDELHKIPEYLSCIITESIKCYRLGLYQICIPSLFSAIEGVMTFYLDARSAIKYQEPHQKKLDDPNLTFETIGLISISSFLENYFKCVPFSNDEEIFCKLNRHWALHGKYKVALSQKSVVKLFVAISTALMVVQLLK